jgi:hypothetical protein
VTFEHGMSESAQTIFVTRCRIKITRRSALRRIHPSNF